MTAEEINRRVAIELGWAWVSMKKRGSRHAPRPAFTRTASIPTVIEWELWAGTREDAEADYSKTYGDPYHAVPRYCSNPAAADLVRQEIERRGWFWQLWREPWADSRIDYRAGAGESGAVFWVHGCDSWTMALCRAFLAAVEGV